jgi:hypothetical protein
MTQMRWQAMVEVVMMLMVLVFLGFAVERLVEARRIETRTRKVALARDSVEAVRDTGRVFYMKGPGDDSLRVVERRAVQAEQRADSLDRLLGTEHVARVQLAATVRGMHAEVRSETVYVTPGSDERRGTFEVREAPFTVRAEVALPVPPASGRIRVEVAVDSVPLELRLSCGARRDSGVRPASVSVEAPPWATVRLGRVEQAIEVCSPDPAVTAAGKRSVLRGIAERFGVSVGYSIVRQPNGSVVAGPGIQVGLKVWP